MEEEAKADKPTEEKESLADGPIDVRHETLAQKIYLENRVRHIIMIGCNNILW